VKLIKRILLGIVELSARQAVARTDQDKATQGVPRPLRLAALFTALASTTCMAEALDKAAAGLAASVGIDHSICTPSEINLVKGAN
jgi:hypothetical protein